jgi:phosphomannomutase
MAFTHRFDPTTLREYDIRGTVGGTLFEADAFAIGRCFGSIVARTGGKTVAVGYDGRLSSPALETALVKGLRASGMEAVRIGRGPTPMLYYAATTLKTDGAVMVTGSHNPPDYNGFKMMVGRKPFFGEDIKRLGEMALAGDVVQETVAPEARRRVARRACRAERNDRRAVSSASSRPDGAAQSGAIDRRGGRPGR